ncbi:MAG TPA: HAD family hydrolase [Thermomicrobiales bacterium]|nr:HAD family hydrolase [Thermomicrobiales bacterium]
MKTVIFDLGETLVEETRQWEIAAQAAGVPFFTLAGTIGALIARGEPFHHAFAELGVERVSAVDHGYVVDTSVFYPDAIPTIRTLKDLGYRVGIIANQPDGIAEQLAAMDLPLDVIATSATYGVAKPDPAFFERVVADCGVPASEIAYVGDRLDNDILPAQSIGLHAIFIRRGPWGVIQSRWPEASQAHHRIDTLDELPAVLERIDAG